MSWTEKSTKAWNNAWNDQNWGSSAMGLMSGVTGVLGAAKSTAEINDTYRYHRNIDQYNNASYNTDNFFSLMEDYENNKISNLPSYDDINLSTGQKIGGTLSGTVQGAISGAQVGGPWGAVIGGAVGLGAGLIGWAAGDAKAQREKDALEAELEGAKKDNLTKFQYAANLINDRMFSGAALNYREFGGDLYDNAMARKYYNNGKVKYKKSSYIGNIFAYGGQMKLAGDWSNGVTVIGEGGSHEMNPYGGVQIGVDQDYVPNLVEEGEVIFNDYVFSNRLKPTEKQLEEVGLCDSLAGKTFADIAKKISRESEERPNDPISKNGLIDGMMKLEAIQEDIRARKEAARIKRESNKLSPEEQSIVAQSMQPQTPEMQEEEMQPFNFNARYAANGNPQDELNSEYGEGYAYGGNIFADGNWLPILSNEFQYYTGTPGKGGKYDQGYLDWLKNYDIENSKYWGSLSDLYKKTFNQDLTVDRARELGKDEQFGHFHKAMGDAYSNYLRTEKDLAPKLSKIDNTTTLGKKAEEELVLERPEDSGSAPRTNYKPIKEDNNGKASDWLRYAPAIGSGLRVLGDIFGLTNRPDYTNAKMIGDAANRIRNARAPQLYNYMRYTPFDVNYEQNRLQNVGLGSQRNVLNTTSGNRSAALSALLLNNASTMSGMGDLYRKAKEYNDTQRKLVSEFNRGTDQFNAQSIMSASQQNQAADRARAEFIMNEARMRDQIDTATSAAKSNNISNFFNNLGRVGQDVYSDNQLDWLLRSGWLPQNRQVKNYPYKKGGKIKKTKRLI